MSSPFNARAVIFDIGDTMLRERGLRYEAVEFAMNKLQTDGFVADSAPLHKEYLVRDQELTGHNVNHLFSNLEMVRGIFETHKLAKPEFLANSYLAIHRSFVLGAIQRDHRLVEMLEEISAEGWAIGVLTDGTTLEQYLLLEKLGVLKLIDAVTVSEDVGQSKPAFAMFKDISDKLKIPLNCCVMVGNDRARDIEGAQMFGMKSILVNEFNLESEPEEIQSILSVSEKLKTVFTS
ncbi:HAD family hydrolase [Shimia ponticola]|uniref:HAD family hydrolase n=1 Tax=Shimia ponticola TaxID=2582893 RepID=UPI0011BF8891|nr:HAD family hydrolase [Shimia ponticola]